MNITKRAIAAMEVLLVFPATLFMVALFMRNVQPQQCEPAHTAQNIVDWYAARPHLGLWVLLIALPFAVAVTGCGVLSRNWGKDPQMRQTVRQVIALIRVQSATLLVAASTLTALAILAIVGLHVLTD